VRLSDTAVRKAKPKEGDYKLSDGAGLYLLVKVAGAKLWRLKYRYGGKERVLALGKYPEVTLAKARQGRDDAKKVLAAGQDPVAERKLQEILAQENTFESVARRWFEVTKSKWTEVHAADVIHSLERDVFPKIGPMAITSIKPPVVLAALREIEARPAIETARRVQQRISAVFVFAIASGVGHSDPAAVVRPALKPLPTKTRQPAVLDLSKAREVLRAGETQVAHPVTKLALRFLALTVVRPGVQRRTPWVELDDLRDNVWRIPAARMKLSMQNKQNDAWDFWVPLSKQAQDVLAVLRVLTGRGPLVFPNARHAHKPMSENAIGYLLNRAGYQSRQVPHGWRATFSTIMNETYPADRAIIDLMLAHVPTNEVEGAYNRARHIERRTELAQLWADMLLEGFPPADDLVNGPRR